MAEATNLTLLIRLAPMVEKMVRREVCLLTNSPDEANKLASNLQKIQQFLRDAERKAVTDPKVKSWLDKLLDISYEIDDVLDEWEWENMRIQFEDPFESSASDNPLEKVSSFLQSVCLCFKNVVDRRNVNLNIKQLNERLDQVDKENENEFKFLPNLNPDNSQDINRTETTSLVNVSQVIGRDDEKKFLVSELLDESSSSSQTENDIPIVSSVGAGELSESSSQTENEFPVISIVGAGGMGKTTLAQLVFNDQSVQNHFDVKIWVCVSDPFDEIKIAKDILENLNEKAPKLSQFNALLQRIKRDISGKKFLLVIDDVWTEDDTKWESFREALKSGAPGSKILVTTRKATVARAMGSSQRHIDSLNPISESDSWRMLSEIAFQHRRKEYERKTLEDIGLEIVKKCKGLPLAIKVIGSLLQSKSREEEWRNVLESQWWKWDEVRKDIFAPLALSYDELHPVTKRCFSYCATFPKDTLLDPDTLIRMWCAQGFLSSIASNDDMEQKGRKIFDDLAMRSLFHDFKTEFVGNNIILCKMHDIVHDFAQFLSKDEYLIVENFDSGATSTDVGSTRHLILLGNRDINSILKDNEKCRRLFIHGVNIPPELFRYLKRVRVLILRNCFSVVIPSEIGSLIHSRYLDLTNNYIKELPKAICDLYNLETLILDDCENLSAFPPGIDKLSKLRHIFNEGTEMEFPEGTEKLTNLRTLSKIHASSQTNWENLKFLKEMNKLGGCLEISIEGLDGRDADKHRLLLEAANQAKLEDKTFIQQLRLIYKGNVPNDVVEALKPHQQLEVVRFGGPYVPRWLRSLAPSLKFLQLEDIHEMKILNFKELYTFPKLRHLSFTKWKDLEEWEDISEAEENNINLSIFPSLEILEFLGCPKLKALPHRLLRRSRSLKVLDVFDCEKLKERYQDWKEVSQIHGISRIPKVYIR